MHIKIAVRDYVSMAENVLRFHCTAQQHHNYHLSKFVLFSFNCENHVYYKKIKGVAATRKKLVNGRILTCWIPVFLSFSLCSVYNLLSAILSISYLKLKKKGLLCATSGHVCERCDKFMAVGLFTIRIYLFKVTLIFLGFAFSVSLCCCDNHPLFFFL